MIIEWSLEAAAPEKALTDGAKTVRLLLAQTLAKLDEIREAELTEEMQNYRRE